MRWEIREVYLLKEHKHSLLHLATIWYNSRWVTPSLCDGTNAKMTLCYFSSSRRRIPAKNINTHFRTKTSFSLFFNTKFNMQKVTVSKRSTSLVVVYIQMRRIVWKQDHPRLQTRKVNQVKCIEVVRSK